MEGKGTISETGEYFFPDVETSEFTDLNVEGRVFYNSDTGEACVTTTQLMCNATWSGEPYNHIPNANCYVYGGSNGNNFSNLYQSSSTVCFGSGGGGGGGTPDGSSNNTGGLGGSGGSNDPIDVTPIPCRTGNCIEADIETPCDKLTKLFDSSPGKPNLKPILVALQGTLPQDGENGRTLKKTETGQFGAPSIPATNNNAINGPVGLLIFGEVHTHPFQGPHEAYPMFSWTDVHRLLEIYDHTAVYNQPDVVIMLVVKDDAGVNQVYSLIINDVIAYKNMINQKLNESNLLLSLKGKLAILDEKLGDRYFTDNNYERAFLEHFADFNVSLYKADSSLTSWEKLSLTQPSSSAPASNTISATPCN